jgi:transketolase
MPATTVQTDDVAQVLHQTPGIDGDAINAIRFLAIDAVERAGSGHPGTAMALAPLAYRLYTRHLRHDPDDPDWVDRDRVVLSIGHASTLLYAALHLSGYALSIDDLKSFRQWGSRTPGHPERGETPGIDISTGPLGQGVANALGLAMAERMLAARFNRPGHDVVDHRTWVFAGDGDMMEGISSEAASLAGHLGLGKLTIFYDDNHISLEGPTSLHFSEDVQQRFEAYGWHVTGVSDVNDLSGIDAAVAECLADDRPSLVIVRTHIGFGSPVQDTAKAHGAPLGAANAAVTRERLGWQYGPFEIPSAIYHHWRDLVVQRAAAHDGWSARFDQYRAEFPDAADEFERVNRGQLPFGWESQLPTFEVGTSVATRVASGRVLNACASVVPELVGGAADVGPSTETYLHDGGHVPADGWGARNLHFGVREHAMGAAVNGMAAHGGLRPFGATFFVFVDYLRPAIRMAAIMRLPSIFVLTHDSIGLGEDGQTHQPVEQLASLRAMPGVVVLRPADANETAGAWKVALQRLDGPTLIVLSRQALPVLDPAHLDVAGGASVVASGDDATIIATGSEVEVALAARDLLAPLGITASVVSMPSWELFRRRPLADREAVLPPDRPTVAVEAAATTGWHEWADAVIGLDHFGASAPAAVLYEQFGITATRVATQVHALSTNRRPAGSVAPTTEAITLPLPKDRTT